MKMLTADLLNLLFAWSLEAALTRRSLTVQLCLPGTKLTILLMVEPFEGMAVACRFNLGYVA